jgi:sterol desaturase/sphingolipid hydroxylase (fatty acid hydroxylase superfamily)
MTHVLPYVWYPAFLAISLATFFGLLASGASPLIAAYVPAIATGIAIVLLERRFPERDDWRPKRSDVLADAAFMGVVMVAVPRLLMAGAVVTLASFTQSRFMASAWPHHWPLAAQMMVMVLAVDLVRYWLHRACHAWMPLWRLHEVHHSPDLLYVLNVGRFHPLEKALHFSLDTVPFLFLGVGPEVFAGYFLLYSVNGFFQHSNVRLRYGWLNYVVGSAETHRWHHARDPREASCNFGNTTIVWDLLFGTWKLPGPVNEIGIMDRRYPKGFMAQMAAPFRRRDGRPRRSPARWLADTLVGASLRLRGWAAGRKLARDARDPMRAQRALLAALLRENRDTTFGREHGFAAIDGYEAFAARVPVAEFEQLRPYVDAEIERAETALTASPPRQYVRTSGTTGVPKDIPLVDAHLQALRDIHRDAVAFQYRKCPEAFEGGIVAMVSPEFEGWLANGKPYGSASGIVAGNTPAAVREKFVVPRAVLAVEDSRVKYLLVLRLAIARRDVTYVGAANPSTLLTLARLYRENHAALVQDVRAGTFFLADRCPPEALHALRGRLAADAERAAELAALHEAGKEVRLAHLFPALRLVVTWTCASAGIAAEALRAELPRRARLMELGYVASELRGTITIGRRAGSGLPTFHTHFFEFAERDLWDAGNPRFLTLDQLRRGREYYLVVTTPSGLYRYFINDIVRVTGFLHATPLLRFVQKGKGVTNITGEKLYEAQVLQAVREAMAALGRSARFVMMLADEEASRYRLYVEPEPGAPLDAVAFGAATDRRLARINVEYHAKRESDRLGAIEARWLSPDTADAFKRHCVARGQREGQFKMVSLEYRRKFDFDLDARAVPA